MAKAERAPGGIARCCTEQVEKTGYENSNGCGVNLMDNMSPGKGLLDLQREHCCDLERDLPVEGMV